MKIGIDCRKFYDVQTNKGAGVERYTYHLVRNLLSEDKHNDYVLFFYGDIGSETVHRVKANNPRVKIIKLFPGNSRIPLWDNHIHFSKILKQENLDLTIFPANIIPLFYKRKSILVVHDLAIYSHPEWFPDKQWFSTKVLVPRSLKKAQTIVTVSQHTKNDLLKLFPVAPEKVYTIYPGIVVKDSYLPAEKEKVLKKFDITSNYIFFVGTIEPRKNILNLIKAFSNYLFENEESQLSLILAGGKGWKFQPIFQTLNEFNQRLAHSQIKYIGKISNRERNILIKEARAFVFPSLYEGFGFPILEAMALGTPVLTSNNSSLQELGANAAYLINPEDPNEIRPGIKKIVEDNYLRQTLIANGKRRAAEFNWTTTVKKFMTLLK